VVRGRPRRSRQESLRPVHVETGAEYRRSPLARTAAPSGGLRDQPELQPLVRGAVRSMRRVADDDAGSPQIPRHGKRLREGWRGQRPVLVDRILEPSHKRLQDQGRGPGSTRVGRRDADGHDSTTRHHAARRVRWKPRYPCSAKHRHVATQAWRLPTASAHARRGGSQDRPGSPRRIHPGTRGDCVPAPPGHEGGVLSPSTSGAGDACDQRATGQVKVPALAVRFRRGGSSRTRRHTSASRAGSPQQVVAGARRTGRYERCSPGCCGTPITEPGSRSSWPYEVTGGDGRRTRSTIRRRYSVSDSPGGLCPSVT